MGIYILTFITTTLLFAVSSKIKKNQRVYIEVIGLLLLCSIAGLRAASVGTDTTAYFRPICNAAISSTGFKEYLSYSWYINSWSPRTVSQYEIGFVLFVYIVGAISKSVFFIQFCVQCLIVLPIYYVVKKCNKIPLWFSMIVFELLFYNESFNMIRQSIAMSFIFSCVYLWSINKRKQSFIFLITAISFHSSAIIGFIIIGLFEFVKKGKRRNRVIYNFNLFLAIAFGFSFLFLNNIIANFLQHTSLNRFAGYILGNVELMPNQILIRLPLLILFGVTYITKSYKKIENFDFYFLSLIYCIILSQFTSVNTFGGRISQYFSEIGIISYPFITVNLKYKKITTILLLLYLGVYWFYYYIYSGSGETIPYVFL